MDDVGSEEKAVDLSLGKVILISPDQRGGAPRLLHHFGAWLKKHEGEEIFTIKVLDNGSSAIRFDDLGTVLSVEKALGKWYRRLLSLENKRGTFWGSKLLRLGEKGYERWLHQNLLQMGVRPGDRVIANTVCSAREARVLKKMGCQIYVWIMEDFRSACSLGSYHGLQWISEISNKVVFPSLHTFQEYRREGIVREDQGVVCYPMMEVRSLAPDERQSKKREWRKKHGLQENSFIVGGCGNISARKSPDLLIQTARLMMSLGWSEGIEFVWMGSQNDVTTESFKRDCVLSGVSHLFRWIQPELDSVGFFSAVDCLALVSRDEPFGLVVLEAATFGKPILCFQDAGGAPEFVKKDAGIVIPYLDLHQLAQKILELRDRPEWCAALGKQAEGKMGGSFSNELLGRAFFEVMKRN